MTYYVNDFPIVYAVGGWWTKPRHIRIRDTRAGDQSNVALYVKKSRVNRICWVSSKYHIICLIGMCVGDIRYTELRYIESPRDVCWGSGIVALDDLIMFVPFP